LNLRLHAVEPRSAANGPGFRLVIWFQGCSLDCPGCFNPETHDPDGGFTESVPDLLKKVSGTEGVTVTGGEPFEQPEGLLALVRGVRQTTRLSTLVFSGLTLGRIRRLPLGPAILGHVDVLVDGRYSLRRHLATGLRGSTNQRVHLLNGRYTMEEIESTPMGEVLVAPDGRITVTGVDPPRR
jgi:anaerobic ribonucleoside-triphosphate reductase activating protein